MASEHEHTWQEINRYLPLTDADLDTSRLFPEPPRDEEGHVREMDVSEYEPPPPHIFYQCTECPETKEVEVAADDFDTLKSMLDSGEMEADNLSQLPLRELIPSMADEEGVLSGASRLRAGTRGGEGA